MPVAAVKPGHIVRPMFDAVRSVERSSAPFRINVVEHAPLTHQQLAEVEAVAFQFHDNGGKRVVVLGDLAGAILLT